MGCSDCQSKGGCDHRKSTQRELLDAAVARVYRRPQGEGDGAVAVEGAAPGPVTWGLLDDEARFGAGVPRAEVRRLGRSIAAVARAPAFFRAGDPADLCDYVWVLCVGRRPSVLEIADGSAAAPGELLPGVAVEERWLRLAVSSVARLATLQEVTLSLALDEAGRATLREAARPGVYDPVLLKRVRAIVALLEASEVAHVDFGLLDRPLSGALAGDYPARYGCEPRLVNFLFYAAPPTVQTVSAL